MKSLKTKSEITFLPKVRFTSEIHNVIIIGEMGCGNALFMGDCEIDTIFKIFQKLGTPDAKAWSGIDKLKEWKGTFPKWQPKGWENIRNTKAQIGEVGINLLEGLMVYAPQLRLSARNALLHPYFAPSSAPAATAAATDIRLRQ